MKKDKKRSFYLLFVIFFCSVLIFAQDKKNSRPYEGSCKTIINFLQELHGNDSIAIEIFKKEYRIFDDTCKVILKKNYNEIIQYFNSEEGKNCFCRSRITTTKRRIDPVLLDRDISSSKKQESSKE